MASSFRNEIQALKNQAKARGHGKVSDEEAIQKAFVHHETAGTTHSYVYKDLVRSGIFLVIILVLLFVCSVKLSTFPLFGHIRTALHISALSL